MKKKSMRFILALLLMLAAFGTAVSVQAKEKVPASGKAAVKQGWVESGGKKYYVSASGKHKTGWFTSKKKKYYLDPKANGAAVTGLKKIGGKYYCFNKEGQMLTDKPAYKVGKKYYAINSKGVARIRRSAPKEKSRNILRLTASRTSGATATCRRVRSAGWQNCLDMMRTI